jgi:hypothetical protein
VLCWASVCRHAVAITPEGPLGRCRFTGVASPRPSDGGLPRYVGGSAPSSLLSGPARRSLALRPAGSPGRLGGPLSRRLRRFRYLCRRSDSFRLERLSSPGGTRTHWNNPHLFTSRNIISIIGHRRSPVIVIRSPQDRAGCARLGQISSGPGREDAARDGRDGPRSLTRHAPRAIVARPGTEKASPLVAGRLL